MRPEEYDRMYALEDSYWWFQGRRDVIFSLLDSCGAFRAREDGRAPVVVDLGCGTGSVLERLRSMTRPVGLDFSPLALSYSRRRGLRALARSDATSLPLRDDSVDLILALDLFEHIEDDGAVRDELARALRPGGMAVIAAPAHPFLWSEHDEALHHFRRYTRRGLRDLLQGKRLRLNRLTYAISFTFVPIVLYRLLTRPFKGSDRPKTHVILLPKWLNSLLIRLLRVEARLMRRFSLPFGVSLIAVLRKERDGT